MIVVDKTLCSGCGICVDVCPTEAITLINDVALVDAERCDGCEECVEVCSNQALTWIPEPELETITEPSSLSVIQPLTEITHTDPTKLVPWRRAIFPVVGGALSWAGRELVPRLAPMALDVLEGALDRRLNRWSKHDRVRSIVTEDKGGGGRQRRHRRRRGHPQE